MKMLRFDSVGGASGNMVLGALVAAGADLDSIRSQLEQLPLEHFELTLEKVESHGLHGLRLNVHADDPDAHGHGGHHHVHRHLADVEKIIDGAGFPEQVKQRAKAVFHSLAEAEGRVHGKDKYSVHFHEVGAMDAIVDIVGSCLALQQLGIEKVVVGPLPLGTGTVQCAHGMMPVPVPAVVELLKHHPVMQTDEPYELVTPTGAALLATLKSDSDNGEGEILASGNGFGSRTLNGRPNMLRATVVNLETNAPVDFCLMLECDIDDMTPELLGDLSPRLLDAGALDVVLLPAQMKKARPGSRLCILCRPAEREALLDLVFRGTTTFGVREYPVSRTVLDRSFQDVETRFGSVRIKIGTWKGDSVTWAPEMEDCIRLADQHGVPARTVYEEAFRAARG